MFTFPRRQPLVAEALNELVYRAQAGCKHSHNKIIEYNLGLVANTCFRYKSAVAKYPNIELDDLFQEGSIGLNRAIELFDPTKGFAFSTYSSYWIRQAMDRYIDNHKSLIRIPIHVSILRRKLYKSRKVHTKQFREVTKQCIVEHIDSIDIDTVDSKVCSSIQSADHDIHTIKRALTLLSEDDLKIVTQKMNRETIVDISKDKTFSRETTRQRYLAALSRLRMIVEDMNSFSGNLN